MSSSNYCNLHSGQGKLLGWVTQVDNIYRFFNCIWLPDFFILGKLCIFLTELSLWKANPGRFTWVFSASISLFCLDLPFYKTSPGIPIHFLICFMACNEKEPDHLLFEHLLTQSKTYYLSCVHRGLEYFLRINGAVKWGKVCTLLKELVLIWVLPDSWQSAVMPLWTVGSFSESKHICSDNL